MKSGNTTVIFLAAALCTLFAQRASATFDRMQIYQVIGGVNGDTTAQAIELRMRANAQNSVFQGLMRVRDAAGMNPVLLINFTTSVAVGE